MYTFTTDDCRQSVGKIGEQAVLEFFEDAVRTDDWYDSEKDGTINGMTYEVKTSRLNLSTKSFWIDKKQWHKCDNVDLLFFVKIPEKECDGIILYLSVNHKEKKALTYVSDGRVCRKYPLTECLPLYIIKDSRVNAILEHSKLISKHERFK
jgi:hypothetical protein